MAGGILLCIARDDVTLNRHKIRIPVNAEIAEREFMPCLGQITEWQPLAGPEIRVDTHCYTGYFVPPFYDWMIARLIVREEDRNAAISCMCRARANFRVGGVHSTIPFHQAVLSHPDFHDSRVTTRWVEEKFMTQGCQGGSVTWRGRRTAVAVDCA